MLPSSTGEARKVSINQQPPTPSIALDKHRFFKFFLPPKCPISFSPVQFSSSFPSIYKPRAVLPPEPARQAILNHLRPLFHNQPKPTQRRRPSTRKHGLRRRLHRVAPRRNPQTTHPTHRRTHGRKHQKAPRARPHHTTTATPPLPNYTSISSSPRLRSPNRTHA